MPDRDDLQVEVQLKLQQSEAHKRELAEAHSKCAILQTQLDHLRRPQVSHMRLTLFIPCAESLSMLVAHNPPGHPSCSQVSCMEQPTPKAEVSVLYPL